MTDYATLTELKTHLRITNSTDDTELSAKLTAASRRVDGDTGRIRGYGLDVSTSQRIYTPDHETLLLVDDIATATALVVEIGRGTGWSTVDSNSYDLLPPNAVADGRAIEAIKRINGFWPLWGIHQVRVTATFGWPAVPDNIKAATLLVAARLFRRKDSPEGVKGSTDLGQVYVSRYDPDYDWLINRYVKDVK